MRVTDLDSQRRFSRARRLAGCAVLLAAVGAVGNGAPQAAPPLHTTWVVDDDGPANFADLPEAVSGARDGDTIVLRAGRYRAAQVRGKGLTIVGAGPGSTFVEQRDGEGAFFTAVDLSNQQPLVLAHLTGIGRGRSLELSRLHGAAIVTDLVIDGRGGARGPALDQCLNAYLARVAVVPAAGPLDASAGNGMTLANGRYALTQIVAIGCDGRDASSPRGRARNGGNGLAIQDAEVESALSEWVGGRGGTAQWDVSAPFCPEAAYAGAGGPAVSIAGKSTLRLFGDGHQRLAGGSGGAGTRNPWEPCWSFAGDGSPALRLRSDVDATQVMLGGVERVAGPAGSGDPTRPGKERGALDPIDAAPEVIEPPWPTLAIESASAVGSRVAVRILGAPGDRVTLLIGRSLVAVPLKKSDGFHLHVGAADALSLPQPEPIGASGTLLVRAELPSEATLVGNWFAIQAVVVRGVARMRRSFTTNVDVAVIADGQIAGEQAAHR